MVESLLNKLTKDVITEILMRLPVKSLLRFRCICKAWCYIIKNPDFVDMHFNHSTGTNDGYVLIKRYIKDSDTNILSTHSNTESLTVVSPDLVLPHFKGEFVQVLGPCNGLVCITNYNIIVLCNPATREFTLLPARPFGYPPDMMCTYCGAGFGFDSITNDYKVVRIVDLEDDDDYRVHIYKADVYRRSTDHWREIDYKVPHLWHADCFEIFFHGATHWSAQNDGEKVLSFNINTELFHEFGFPEGIPPFDGKHKALTILNECLTMLAYTEPWPGNDKKFIDVWMMKEYGVRESWIQLFAIGPLLEISQPLTSWKNCKLFIEREDGQLISCDLDTQEIKKFDIFSFPKALRALVYKESLVSINT